MSPGGGALAELPGLLRAGLRGVLAERQDLRADDGRLRMHLRSACDRARSEGVRVEQLLIVLKKCWRELPEIVRMQHRDAMDMLARLATACIDEYYADGDGHRSNTTSRRIRDGGGRGTWSRRPEIR
jgi:hypothetical protein